MAKAAPEIGYSLDPALLDRVIGNYLEAHPNHNNPLNLVVRKVRLRYICNIQYYDMHYKIECKEQGQVEFIPELRAQRLVDGKATYLTGHIGEGKFQYIKQLKAMRLVDGKITFSDGLVAEGKRQYFEQLKAMCLVDGKITETDGQVAEGKFQYIEQLKEVCLVDGKETGPDGLFQEGKFQYIEQWKGRYLVDGKITFPDGHIEEGKRQYVEPLKGICLVGVDGTRTAPNGDIYSGTFAYVPGMDKDTQLINGTLTYSNGRSETGEFAYIHQLNRMKLVHGITKNAEGEVVKHGRREYVPQKNGMMLMEGLSVFPDGKRQEGIRSYVPELNEVVLTNGSISHGNTVQTGIWTYSWYEGRMVFSPKPPQPKLPQHLRSQIQSAVQELASIQHRFDSAGKYNTSAAMLNAAADQAALAQNPEQYNNALQSFKAQYKTLTRELSLLTHPDKIKNYSADVHGAVLQQLVSLRESIDGQVNRWGSTMVNWSDVN
ncbi:MAG: hypothetical protein RLO04_11565 [Limnobacter sp.]|uniref:hypothetical protein n=1 Tax=Limnobacter sp. TaxID=2003368 RepID=UPI0032EC5726